MGRYTQIYIYITYMHYTRAHLCYKHRTTIHCDTLKLQVLLLAWLAFLLYMAREVPWNKWTNGQVDPTDAEFTREKDVFTTEDDYFTREHDQQKGFDYRPALILLGKMMTNKPCVVVAVVAVVVVVAVFFNCGHWDIEFHDMIYNHLGMIFGLPETG